MVRFLRSFIAALLALSVPLQAFASAGACLAFSHHGAEAHSHHGSGDADHRHAHNEDQSQEQSLASAGYCASCAACCCAGGIAAAPRIFLPDERTDTVDGAVPASRPSLQLGTLDRPPLAF